MLRQLDDIKSFLFKHKQLIILIGLAGIVNVATIVMVSLASSGSVIEVIQK